MKHIKVLEESGLIASEKGGAGAYLSIEAKAACSEPRNWLSEQRKLWEGRADRLAQYVETLTSGGKTLMNEDKDLTVSRIIKAPRSAVWKAWQDPEHFVKWWAPAPVVYDFQQARPLYRWRIRYDHDA